MLLVAVCIAVLGGIIALKLKVPAGALIGAMVAVAALNLLLGTEIQFPIGVKFLSQSMTGAYIGSKIQKSDLYALRGIIVPAVILSITMLLFNLATSWALLAYTGIDLATALFATAPAGITDMTLASMDFGADAPKVAVLQMVRLVSVLSIMPWIVRWVGQKNLSCVNTPKTEEQKPPPKDWSLKRVAITSLIGLVFGSVGYWIGMPAGAISFSMFGCAAYNIYYQKAFIPLKLRQSIQFIAGALIGGMVTRGQLLELLGMSRVVFIVIIAFLILNLTSAALLYKFGKMDPVTALLASSAGGLTDMAIIAEELGAESTKVATMQLIRVVSVIALYPAIISMLLRVL